ncbi:MAG: hypothetical protein E7585_00195 [Ruminococcaceae bacterium]|nr:hypothetical protein [Oscillospiraceae bacterium]
MGENRFSCSGNASVARDSFGIEASRILDACRDRDCFENVRVFLTCVGEDLIARTNNVRVKKAKLCGANIVTDPIQFNRGFYAVTIKFYVSLVFEVCVPMGQSQEFEGVAVLEKRVVLYGGESNVSVFRSSASDGYCAIPEPVCCGKNHPEAVVEVVEPIVLGARIVNTCSECRCCCGCSDIPVLVTDSLNGTLVDDGNRDGRFLTVSLGLFSVVRLVREGQLLVQGAEFCLPDKECCEPSEEDPCGTFRKMPFPAAEFCPITAPVNSNALGNGHGNGNGRSSRCCSNS